MKLKFRAWHKSRKKYYNVLHLHLEEYRGEGPWVTCQGFCIIEQKPVHVKIQPGECIIEQCISLKDKNGIQIYDGDIVAFKQPGEDFLTRGMILFDEYYPSYVIAHTGRSFPCEVSEIEIIGNIHQNENLIK